MKAKIATAVSVIAVLGAGSAAALVNTQILDGGPTESGASKAVLPPASTVVLTVPSVTDPITVETVRIAAPDDGPTGSSSTTSTTDLPTTSSTTLAVADEPSGFLTSFNVGDAGVVTVDVVDGQLVLVAAEPKSGWTVTKAQDDSNDDSDEQENEVEVEFVSADVRVEFEAEFVDGRIVPKVESSSTRQAASSTGQAAVPAGGAGSGVASAPGPVSTTGSSDDDHADDDHADDDADDDRSGSDDRSDDDHLDDEPDEVEHHDDDVIEVEVEDHEDERDDD